MPAVLRPADLQAQAGGESADIADANPDLSELAIWRHLLSPLPSIKGGALGEFVEDDLARQLRHAVVDGLHPANAFAVDDAPRLAAFIIHCRRYVSALGRVAARWRSGRRVLTLPAPRYPVFNLACRDIGRHLPSK